MHQPVLPHFPEEYLDQEALDRFSDELISAYRACRITTPVRIQALIKRTPVRLNFDASDKEIVNEPPRSVPQSAPDKPQTVFHESVVAETRTLPVEPSPDEVQKCFLHPKSKTSCRRCQEYLSIRKGHIEPSPKKPRP